MLDPTPEVLGLGRSPASSRGGAARWRVPVLIILGCLGVPSCGGKIGTFPSDEATPPSGQAGATGSSTGGTGNGAAVATGGATASGGAEPFVPDDGDAGPADSTGDACPCPALEETPDLPGKLVAHFPNIGCYCSTVPCPTTRGEATDDLCERVEALGAGEVTRSVGCGTVLVTLMTGTLRFEWFFDEATDEPLGAWFWGDSPGGLCDAHVYLYGEYYECPEAKTCRYCGEDRLGLRPCLPPL